MRDSKWQERLAYRIANRWRYWEPWCYRADKLMVSTKKLVHVTRVTMCLGMMLPWTTIVNNKLDDPLAPEKDFRFNLNAAVERRRQAKEKQRANSSRTSL